MKIRILYILAFVVFVLPSCITNKDKLYLQKEKTALYAVSPYEEYKLCVDDEIIYYLMTTSEETQELYNRRGSQGGGVMPTYRIYENGCVILPTIGEVYVEGKTIREAERIITESFKTKIVSDAEVKIAMANNYFYIQGDNGKGRFYAYKENLNIFQAIAMAGDISSTGDKSRIKMIRKGKNGLDEVKTFDLRKESIVESEYYYIHPNDVIYIPTNPNSFFRIESFSGFMSFIVTPLSLVMMSLSFIKNNKK